MPHRSIRAKLTVGALVPFAAAMLICTLTGVYLIDSRVAHQAREKVRTDINTAREAYRRELAHMDDILQATVDTPLAAKAVTMEDRALMETLLAPLKHLQQFDMLTVLDRQGRVLYRSHNPSRWGDNLRAWPSVAQSMAGQAAQGAEVLSAKELLNEQQELARRADIVPLNTPKARRQPAAFPGAGMLMVATTPVKDSTGAVVGVLYGGLLLNNNNALVDRIKQTVYEGVQHQGRELGTSTIFLDDVRISTNVRTLDGRRAIGTRLSEEVYNQVILGKQKWIGSAFVVNEQYITAYEPIFDLRGGVIGALYVGMLEQPFSAIRRELFMVFAVVILLCTMVSLLVSWVIGNQLSMPIKLLEAMARRVADGERDLHVSINTHDELEQLASEFNVMTRALTLRETEIQELNRSLEEKVEQRTAQLAERTAQLLQAQADLARAEKLAGIGTLAAGVAHEINNPLAIIRGNTEVLEMTLPPDHPQQEEVRVISRQIERMTRIIGNLLSFARQNKLRRGTVALHALLNDVVAQLGYQSPLEGITVVRDFSPGVTTITADLDQLRQVFTNLMNNAIQAMDGQGTLTIATRPGDDGTRCSVEIADTGCGIPPEQMEKIFTPFFTTKHTGTGLGLAVSYGIVKDHGGEIRVTSSPGAGTTFHLDLPTGEASQESAE